MYHRVLDATDLTADVHPGMYVTRDAFARHVAYVARNYRAVGPAEFDRWLEGHAAFDRTPCLITFDDGWEDNYRHAFPLLSAHGLPATIFLVTSQIGAPGMLSWPQVREMEAAGIAFGSHTESHAALPSLTEDEVRQELAGSKLRLAREIKDPTDWFCYPKGAYTEAVRRIASELYGAAVTTRRGLVSPGDDRWALNRIGVHDDVSFTVPLFACRLSLV